MGNKNSGLLGSGNGIEELMMLKEMGVLDGDQNNDQMTKIMMFMSLQNNSWMDDMRSYTKQSKKGGGGGGSSKKSDQGDSSNMFSMLQSFNSIQMANVFQQVEGYLSGIAKGLNLNDIAPGYSLSTFPTGNGVADAKLIKAIMNQQSFLASLVQQESALERTEAFYSMLEAFEGNKTWGNSANTSALLPMMLLGGGSLGGSLTSGSLPAFVAPF